ncbi:MAG: aminotransferase class V-fold PLP-dependent enzyme [SAR202 cluster bacterium]|nr:aminotransferase class V-fold PLP-dependent enzyme [SAR202 cluster bacterium]|tara:strand:+ start:48204 stop:49343 length:1140 start_codon:yes stop_codon:yes gene_type:complete
MLNPTKTSGVYKKIGIQPIINASGTTTKWGGSKLRPEITEAMNEASNVMVDLAELNHKAGEILAKLTNSEAGFVCGGSAAGLVLQAAACIAGNDPKKMSKLPDTEGMKNEIIIQNAHRFSYDQAYTIAGGKLISVGHARTCLPWQLEAAINEKTAAIVYLSAPHTSRAALTFKQVKEIADKNNLPVIVDAATTVPPRANLKKFSELGADLVIISGGKGIRGPQGTGILVGKKNLIQACAANASPNPFIGRSMKVAKEEIIGLITALEIFVSENEKIQFDRFRKMSQMVVDLLKDVPGIKVSVEEDEYDYLNPMAIIKFQSGWKGPYRDELQEILLQKNPRIYIRALAGQDETGIDPFNIDDHEMEIIIERLQETFSKYK